MSYYFSKILKNTFEDTVVNVSEELKKEGFGILTEIDVQDTLKKKLDIDFPKYKILGACNPPFAYKALGAENKIGVLLPCNIIIQEISKDTVEVSAINPLESMSVVKNEKLVDIATEIQHKLKNVIEAL